MITRGLAAAAGLSGLTVAERIADRYGLVPPDHGGIYGAGGTLTYAAQRLLTRHSLAREFTRSQISNPPFANEIAPPSDHFKRLQADGFKDWRLSVEGLVAQPASLSLDDVKRFPVRRQITEIACEEGWSYVAEWAGTPLVDVLNDGDLPVAFGGPLRLRVPRQLGYKSVKFINRLAVTDSLKRFGKGLGSASPEGGYAWYAGI